MLFDFFSLLLLGFLIYPSALMSQEEVSVLSAVSGAESAGVASEMASPKGLLEVKYEEDLLSVKVEDGDLKVLLSKIAEIAGIDVEVEEDVAGKVTLDISGLTLEEGINRILEAADSKNYAASFDKVREGTEEDYLLNKKGTDLFIPK